MTRRSMMVLAAAMAALVIVGAGGVATLLRPGTSALAAPAARGSGDAYIQALAAKLGVSPETLAQAMREVKAERVAKRSAVAPTRAAGRANAAQRAAAQAPGNQRQQLMAALTRLANVTPEELRRAVAENGSLRAALAALGVSDERILGALTEVARAQLQSAVDEGRLTADQADQIAATNAKKLMKRINDTVQPKP